MWRSQASQLRYLPQDGEAVLAHGRISMYEVGGSIQFYVDDLEPLGQGALYAQFERIKTRLDAEGLFDAERKQPLPPSPRRIGVVTSPDAAALRDILNVLRRRYPLAEVILSPTPVQGEAAPPQIVAALQAIARQPVEVVIVARGGGSIEDLWAFNDERVARAIANCPLPVISGVGHETDFTIADFVADVRAPTPSAAAELVSPDVLELRRDIVESQLALVGLAARHLSDARAQVRQQQWRLQRLSPQGKIDSRRQQIDALVGQATTRLRHRLELQRQHVARLSAQLTALSPTATLARGYAVVQKGDAVITHAAQVSPGDGITVKLKDSEFNAEVKKTNHE
jgi:exodeoxyribonuclease VII large subunit